MKEINYPEIDVDQFMAEIRAAVVRRGIDIDATSEQRPKPVIAPPRDLARRIEMPRLTLSPEFEFKSNDHYHVNDFLLYHDAEFVRNAYRAIFKREPDQKGYEANLAALRSGHFNKIDVLSALANSGEGRKQRIVIDGLDRPAATQRLGRVPIIGYLVRWFLALLRLPTSIRRQNQSEATLLAQLQQITEHLNQTSARNVDLHREQTQEMTRQGTQINNFIAQVVSSEIEKAENRVRQAEASTELLGQRVKQLSQIVQQTREEMSRRQKDGAKESQVSSVRAHGQDARATVPSSASARQEWNKVYALFEDQFRGDAADITDRLKFYLPFVERAGFKDGFLDLGSGNGDWLALLKSKGLRGLGVEINEVMLERCRQQRLDVIDSEMISYVESLPDESLNVVSAFHVLEHIPFETTFHLLRQIRRVLRPGGLILFETPSPENLVVAACNFYSDPTHHKPLYPHTLTFVLKNIGFTNVQLQFIHPVEGSPFNPDDSNLQPLHMWFYGPRDYAIVAEKAKAQHSAQS